jgi:Kef-type K+ transport system membrane component KefB
MDIEILHASAFYEFAALLLLASVAGVAGLLLRQPMIVSFIAVGILAGPSAFGIVEADENVKLLAELGVAVLLFLVGLKLDINLIRSLGTVSLILGLGQIIITTLIGYIIVLAAGMDVVTSLYVALALTFSSTIIIVKLLSDKKEVDSLHGRLAIGLLIVQDLVVVIAMMVQSAFGPGNVTGPQTGITGQVFGVLGYSIVMLTVLFIFIRYIANPLMNRIARSSELMIVFAICWATLLAALGHHFGFSKELGGLLAGVSLASTPYREAVVARLSSLRDFLLLFFFISLGSQLELGTFGNYLAIATILSLFVLIGKPIIVMAIIGAMGYRKRTGLHTGLTTAQISEFSLVFMSIGLSLGHIKAEAMSLVTLVGLVTIALSVYMITYSHTLQNWMEPVLGIFERREPWREVQADSKQIVSGDFDIILFGLGRFGTMIAEFLRQEGYKFLGVDFNPDVVRRWQQLGYSALYGDVFDQDFVHMLPLDRVRWVISAIPQHDLGLTHEDPRLVLISALKQRGFSGYIAVSTINHREVPVLKEKGADIVLLPFQDAAHQAVKKIKDLDGKNS